MTRKKLKVGISCHPTYGGSGVVATELGMELARRGHQIHFISYDVPHRLQRFMENIYFHGVEAPSYPLFTSPPYSLALASKMAEVCESQELDLIHSHYAIPHAACAILAKQILKEKAPKTIVTLHGTDITLVGQDRSYLPITRMSIIDSDGITAVSKFLKSATYDKLNIPTKTEIEVINNFVDLEDFRCSCSITDELKRHFCQEKGKSKLLTHVSNFRAVKRIEDVVEIFALVRQQINSKLVLVGDGPERSKIESLCREKGLIQDVTFLGKQDRLAEILTISDVFLLPSQTESFGLAALEALACCVPVVATRVGGIPEVIRHGENGYLAELGDVKAMAEFTMQLLNDESKCKAFGSAGRKMAEEDFSIAKIVDQYEDYYYRVLGV